MHKILIVDDDDAFREALAENVQLTGHYTALEASGADAALRIVENDRDVACIVLDYDFPVRDGKPQPSGLELMERFRLIAPHAPIIMISGITAQRGRVAIESIRNHAVAFLDKPFPARACIDLIDELFVVTEANADAQTLFAGAGFLTADALMAGVCGEALIAAQSDLNLLIVGETGTGKDKLARAIHMLSQRAAAPYILLNCANLSRELFSSELFGHRHGAFTGATDDKKGLFEKAARGTIFLNEITEMPFEAQAGFNQAVEDRKYLRLGETEERTIEARIIAATNRNLSEAIRDEKLREDLKYRFDQVIEVPALRKHKGDIPLLAQEFVSRFGKETLHRNMNFSDEAIALLHRQDWPGNVRQLLSIVKRSAVHSGDDRIPASVVAQELRQEYGIEGNADTSHAPEPALDGTLDETIEDIRRRFIERTLQETHGNVSEASRRLGYATKEGLKRWLSKYGIDPRKYY